MESSFWDMNAYLNSFPRQASYDRTFRWDTISRNSPQLSNENISPAKFKTQSPRSGTEVGSPTSRGERQQRIPRGDDEPSQPGSRRRECKFCRNNGETLALVSSHVLRCPRSQRLICPVLRNHVCEICGASGDLGHTRNYCPLRIKIPEPSARPLPSILERTQRHSCGKRRRDRS